MNEHELNRRWRLILGPEVQDELSEDDLLRESCLNQLYSHEYNGRQATGGQDSNSLPNPVHWLNEVRKVFPQSTVDILQQHGLDHYGLSELLLDEKLLKSRKADIELLQTLLAFRDQIPVQLEGELERIIVTVCQELEAVLVQQMPSFFSGQRIPSTQSRPMPFCYIDWQRVIRRNLRHYQADSNSLVLERLYFYQTQKSQIPWDIYLVVDQSGSMLNSLIHASVMATIFCRLPMLNIHLYLFDTRVVDFTEHAQDPLHILLNVQMGGGTDIAKAMAFTHEQIEQPNRSVVVLISDFYEGGNVHALYQQTEQMKQDGVTLLGLTALDCNGETFYDNKITNQLLHRGMEIAAMTPEHLSQWIAQVIK